MNIARRYVNGYIITANPAKSVTHASFWGCIRRCKEKKVCMLSDPSPVRRSACNSPSVPPGTLSSFWQKLAVLRMVIVKSSWWLFEHHGVASSKMWERHRKPQAVTETDSPAWRTAILNVHQFRWMNCHPAETDQDRALWSILENKNCLVWNGDWYNASDSEEKWVSDVESDKWHDNNINNQKCPED